MDIGRSDLRFQKASCMAFVFQRSALLCVRSGNLCEPGFPYPVKEINLAEKSVTVEMNGKERRIFVDHVVQVDKVGQCGC